MEIRRFGELRKKGSKNIMSEKTTVREFNCAKNFGAMLARMIEAKLRCAAMPLDELVNLSFGTVLGMAVRVGWTWPDMHAFIDNVRLAAREQLNNREGFLHPRIRETLERAFRYDR